MREVVFLCEVIDKNAEGEPPNRIIRFGPLFHIYAHYSDKVSFTREISAHDVDDRNFKF